MAGSPLTIRPLNTGYIPTVPLQYHFHFSAGPYLTGVSSEKVPLPCYAFLIEGGEHPVLVDTGMAWTERAAGAHHPGSWQEPGQDVESLLQAAGYTCADVQTVIFTHLHWDHVYYAEKFAHARTICHRREYEFAVDPIPLYYKSYESPVLGLTAPFRGIELELLDGDTEIVPGVRAFETFGHSPGHISVEVDCADGDSYICAGDSMFSLRNLDPIPELHYDVTPPGRFSDVVECWRSVERQKERAASPQHLLLAHDETLPARLAVNPVIGGVDDALSGDPR
ncbi:MAG TPA: N-acyl homoserine lactonase family protein [Cellulomonas sp.]